MSTTAATFCLGCGTSVPTGSYRRLLCSEATQHVLPVWREILGIVLDRSSVVIDEAALLSENRGFICRKCFRAFEAFKAAKEKLLQSANAALQCIPSRPKAIGGSVVDHSRRRSLEEEDFVHDVMIPAKRARTTRNPTVGSSPSVQVFSG